MDVNPQVAETIQQMNAEAFFWVKFRSQLFNSIQNDTGDEEEFLKRFYMLTNNLDRVNFLYEALRKYNLLEDKFKKDVKSDRDARKKLRKGKNTFVRNKVAKSLRHNTYCIMKAQDSEILAEAYANRSAALMKLKMYEECLEDIDRAIAHGYPKEKMTSLTTRQTMVKKLSRNYSKPNSYEPTPHIPRNQQNPSIPNASRSIEIRIDENNRPRVYAAKEIHIGQVLGVEQCVAFTLTSTASIFHCHRCFELTYNPIPCTKCSQVVYCGEKCRDEAFSIFHRHECALLKTLKHSCDQFKTFLIALRITFWLENESHEKMVEEMYSLMNNLNLKDVGDELLTVCLMAALIYHLTKNHTERFAVENVNDENGFKERVMAHLLICFTHGSLIDEYHPDPEAAPASILRMKYMSQVVGSGLYLFYARFRHSCAPNVHKFHHGTRRVLRALRTIKRGEECFISYGPYYEYYGKERRQEDLLTSRHFKCRCKACEEDWVVQEQETYLLDHGDDALLVKQIAPGKVEDVRNCAERFIQRLKEYEHREPNANLCAVSDIVLYCYAMFGNKREVV